MARSPAVRGWRRGVGFPAFTLVELLVVVGILALLITILMPSLDRVRILARKVKCQTNLHALGRASHLYRADWNGFVPRDYWYGCGNRNDPASFGHYLFAGKLCPYLGGPMISFQRDDNDTYMYRLFKNLPVLMCPCVRDEDFVLTYVVNGMDFDYYQATGQYTSGAASRVDDLPGKPEKVFYLMEANIEMLDPFTFGIYDVLYPGNMPFYQGVPNESPRAIRFDDMRHDGETTLLFFDGHAEPRRLHPDDMPITLFNPLDTDEVTP
ncbi:MAG TPA: type II secretion system protein [Phycisphaerae bacterium]|nr:type II secretion system protein [Phycisphaerae bacterium]